MNGCARDVRTVVLVCAVLAGTIITHIVIRSRREHLTLAILPQTPDIPPQTHVPQSPDLVMRSGHDGYLFSCENIATIDLLGELKRDKYVVTYVGMDKFGRKMSVKMVNTVKNCNGKGNTLKCHPSHFLPQDFDTLLEEILLFQQLKNPNLIRLLGFCVRGYRVGSESTRVEGAVAVYELGEQVDMASLMNLTYSQRLDVSLHLLDLIIYLHKSPIGDLKLSDLNLNHFCVIDNRLNLMDLPDTYTNDPTCENKQNRDTSVDLRQKNVAKKCDFDLPCVNGYCNGHKAKLLLLKLCKEVLRPLILQGNETYPPRMRAGYIQNLSNGLMHPLGATTELLRHYVLGVRSLL